MTNAEQRILRRLADFRDQLDQLCRTADRLWGEGGMTWRAEFLKRGAKAIRSDFELNTQFEDHVKRWSILLWYVHACPRKNDEDLDLAISHEDVRAFEDQARSMLEHILPKDGTERCSLDLKVGIDSVDFEFIFVSTPHAMRLTGMWSVD